MLGLIYTFLAFKRITNIKFPDFKVEENHYAPYLCGRGTCAIGLTNVVNNFLVLVPVGLAIVMVGVGFRNIKPAWDLPEIELDDALLLASKNHGKNPSSSSATSLVNALGGLAQLHKNGRLNDHEYEGFKANLLAATATQKTSSV